MKSSVREHFPPAMVKDVSWDNDGFLNAMYELSDKTKHGYETAYAYLSSV